MAKPKTDIGPEGYRKELSFYDNEAKWREDVGKRYPKAKIVTEGSAHRAFTGEIKVGAFGVLPGYGYIAGRHIADIFRMTHERSNQGGALDVFSGGLAQRSRTPMRKLKL